MVEYYIESMQTNAFARNKHKYRKCIYIWVWLCVFLLRYVKVYCQIGEVLYVKSDTQYLTLRFYLNSSTERSQASVRKLELAARSHMFVTNVKSPFRHRRLVFIFLSSQGHWMNTYWAFSYSPDSGQSGTSILL